jgi:acyl-CoA reductase-like NAD-dependent aldehyde dehydrogenase
MGTIISPSHLERVYAMVQRAVTNGAQILFGGERLTGLSELDGFDFSKGSFYPPTVLADSQIDDEIWQEEVFGPIVVVKRFAVSLVFFFLEPISLFIYLFLPFARMKRRV